MPDEGLEGAQEVVQAGGGAEEGGRERELVGEKQREEGIGCQFFEPSEREVDVGEAGVGVRSERTSEKGGEGKEGRREEIGAKVGEKTLLTSLVGRGKRGEADSRQTIIAMPRCFCFSSQGFTRVLTSFIWALTGPSISLGV